VVEDLISSGIEDHTFGQQT